MDQRPMEQNKLVQQANMAAHRKGRHKWLLQKQPMRQIPNCQLLWRKMWSSTGDPKGYRTLSSSSRSGSGEQTAFFATTSHAIYASAEILCQSTKGTTSTGIQSQVSDQTGYSRQARRTANSSSYGNFGTRSWGWDEWLAVAFMPTLRLVSAFLITHLHQANNPT